MESHLKIREHTVTLALLGQYASIDNELTCDGTIILNEDGCKPDVNPPKSYYRSELARYNRIPELSILSKRISSNLSHMIDKDFLLSLVAIL